MSLLRRVASLERDAGLDRCKACGAERIWPITAPDGVEFYEHVRSLRLVCEQCGRDWTGRAKVIDREAFESV